MTRGAEISRPASASKEGSTKRIPSTTSTGTHFNRTATSETVASSKIEANEIATFEDGRIRTIYTANPKTWKKFGTHVNVWPPSGLEPKFPLAQARDRRVDALTAQRGELVQVSPEFLLARECQPFVGKTGRLTTRYGSSVCGMRGAP